MTDITVDPSTIKNEKGQQKQVFVFKGVLTFETVLDVWKTKNQFFRHQGASEQPLASTPIVFDLKEVKRTDSAGLALLMALFREAQAEKRALYFINIPKQLIDIASVSGVESILPIC